MSGAVTPVSASPSSLPLHQLTVEQMIDNIIASNVLNTVIVIVEAIEKELKTSCTEENFLALLNARTSPQKIALLENTVKTLGRKLYHDPNYTSYQTTTKLLYLAWKLQDMEHLKDPQDTFLLVHQLIVSHLLAYPDNYPTPAYIATQLIVLAEKKYQNQLNALAPTLAILHSDFAICIIKEYFFYSTKPDGKFEMERLKKKALEQYEKAARLDTPHKILYENYGLAIECLEFGIVVVNPTSKPLNFPLNGKPINAIPLLISHIPCQLPIAYPGPNGQIVVKSTLLPLNNFIRAKLELLEKESS